MFHHAKRFSLPPGFTAAGVGQRSDDLNSASPPPPAGLMTLAQLYALAHQRAQAAMEDRKWQELLEKLLK